MNVRATPHTPTMPNSTCPGAFRPCTAPVPAHDPETESTPLCVECADALAAEPSEEQERREIAAANERVWRVR